jgi:hypothetical protein
MGLPRGNLRTNLGPKLPGEPGDLKKHPKVCVPKADSPLETQFAFLWDKHYPELPPEREFRFDLKRMWKFDFAWPKHGVAVELEGGVFTKGRHTRSMGFVRDCEKYNAAVRLGWRVLRYTSVDLKGWPMRVLEEVAALLHDIKET